MSRPHDPTAWVGPSTARAARDRGGPCSVLCAPREQPPFAVHEGGIGCTMLERNASVASRRRRRLWLTGGRLTRGSGFVATVCRRVRLPSRSIKAGTGGSAPRRAAGDTLHASRCLRCVARVVPAERSAEGPRRRGPRRSAVSAASSPAPARTIPRHPPTPHRAARRRVRLGPRSSRAWGWGAAPRGRR